MTDRMLDRRILSGLAGLAALAAVAVFGRGCDGEDQPRFQFSGISSEGPKPVGGLSLPDSLEAKLGEIFSGVESEDYWQDFYTGEIMKCIEEGRYDGVVKCEPDGHAESKFGVCKKVDEQGHTLAVSSFYLGHVCVDDCYTDYPVDEYRAMVADVDLKILNYFGSMELDYYSHVYSAEVYPEIYEDLESAYVSRGADLCSGVKNSLQNPPISQVDDYYFQQDIRVLEDVVSESDFDFMEDDFDMFYDLSFGTRPVENVTQGMAFYGKSDSGIAMFCDAQQDHDAGDVVVGCGTMHGGVVDDLDYCEFDVPLSDLSPEDFDDLSLCTRPEGYEEPGDGWGDYDEQIY